VNNNDIPRGFRTSIQIQICSMGKTCVNSKANLGEKQSNVGVNSMFADIQRHSLAFEDVRRHSLVMLTCLWT